MKYARCAFGDTVSFAEVEGGELHELTEAPYFSCQRTGRRRDLEGARLLAPCEPATIFAMAGNYLDHLRSEHAEAVEAPPEPRPFVKVCSSIVGPGDEIVLPPEQDRVEEEAEPDRTSAP